MDATVSKVRAKRFVRRELPVSFQLTPRDLAILSHVARHRFLNSAQIAALDGGSEQNLRRCLRAMFDHSYLDRPYAQLAHVPLTGPRPLIYGLGRRGARALAEHGRGVLAATDWAERNKRAGAQFIEHTLAISQFMVGLELASRKDNGITLLREADVLAEAPESTRNSREPLRLTVPGLDNKLGISSVIADGLFGLQFPDNTASYFLLELDRGSMPVVRSRFDKTSFQRKLKAYWEAWKAGRHAAHFGIKQIRVLTVTNSAARVDRMIESVFEITGGKGSNFFLFAEASRFSGCLPTEVSWTSGRGALVRLTD
jgi:hypothetical protein